MKKTILSALAICAALLGCQKNEITEVQSSGIDLHATIEDDAFTKTVMDENNNIRWSEGDQIIAFMKTSLGLKYQIKDAYVGETSGYFSKVSSGSSDDLGAGMEWNHIIACYPYAESIKCAKSGDNYTIDIALPSEQTYACESFGNGSFPMVAVSEDNNITFKNVCGGMKLQLKGTQKVVSIQLQGKNNEKLSGAATVIAYTDDETKPAITMASTASTSVTLNCESGVQLNESKATEFIISLPPVAFTKGFIVTITDDAGKTYTVETDKANTVLRSSLLVMPEVTLETIAKPGDYIDEYGINHGPGIYGGSWAPVNCGYMAPTIDASGNVIDKGFPQGKAYQFGRRWGFGFSDKDASVPVSSDEDVTLEMAQSEQYKNTCFSNSISGYYTDLWNLGTEDEPIKSEYDPCPEGWRVPTYQELNFLAYADVSWWTNSSEGTKGFSVYHNDGTCLSMSKWCRCSDSSYVLSWWYRDYVTMSDSFSYYNNPYAVRCRRYNGVLIPVTSLNLSQTSLSLEVGASSTVSATIAPSDANHQHAYWWSSNPDIATVDSNGNVVAVSNGTVVITAMAGLQTAECVVTVATVQGGDYIDEYGENHGPGIKIGETVWAPVNCGYHKDDYKYGKLYQWGRKYGQGYDDTSSSEYADDMLTELVKGPVALIAGQSKDNSDEFYYNRYDPYDWLETLDNNLWNTGTLENPVRTEYDPCPLGWRVPTYSELVSLSMNYSSWTTDENERSGYWFSGTLAYTRDVPSVFFPAAGTLSYNGGNASNRGNYGGYWSSGPTGRFAFYFYFNRSEVCVNYGCRATGNSVRCVQATDEVAEL